MPPRHLKCGLCGATDDKFPYHKIPKNPELKSLWIQALGGSIALNAKICGRHFLSTDYIDQNAPQCGGKLRLLPSAVPMPPSIIEKDTSLSENFLLLPKGSTALMLHSCPTCSSSKNKEQQFLRDIKNSKTEVEKKKLVIEEKNKSLRRIRRQLSRAVKKISMLQDRIKQLQGKRSTSDRAIYKMTSDSEKNINFICKTCCLVISDECGYLMSDKIPQSQSTIRDMIILLVPQMKNSLKNDDVICHACQKILTDCISFRNTCLQTNEQVLQHEKPSYKTCLASVDTKELEDFGLEVTRNVQNTVDQDTYNEDIGRFETVLLLDEGSLMKIEQVVNFDHSYSSKNGKIEADAEISDDLSNDDTEDAEIKTILNSEVSEDAMDEDMKIEDTTTNHLVNFEENSLHLNALADNFDDNSPIRDAKWDIHSIPEIPEEVPQHDRIVSFLQPDDQACEKFVETLSVNGINVYRSVADLSSHKRKRIILLGGSLLCKLCGFYFSGDVTYAKHARSNHSRRNGKYKRVENTPKGEAADTEKSVPKCDSCLLTLSSQEDVEYHRKIHPQFVCELCGKRASTSQGLHVHKLTHKEKADLICEKCGKCFRSPTQLSFHLNSHNEGDHACPRCSKVFHNRQSLAEHSKTTHLFGRSENCQCEECGSICKTVQGFRTHYKYKHPQISFPECVICGIVFPTSKALLKHKAMNSCRKKNIRRGRARNVMGPLRCHICSKVFPEHEFERLKVHMRVHNRSIIFPCDYCERTFKQKRTKLQHIQLKHRHKCTVCLQNLNTPEELDVHMDKHKESIFKCGICGETFNQYHMLNQHLEKKHSERKGIEILEDILLKSARNENEGN